MTPAWKASGHLPLPTCGTVADMSTNLDDYRQQLLFALRMRNIPGERIGEAIAEVESHIARGIDGRADHSGRGRPISAQTGGGQGRRALSLW
jgi:hypothetical protein